MFPQWEVSHGLVRVVLELLEILCKIVGIHAFFSIEEDLKIFIRFLQIPNPSKMSKNTEPVLTSHFTDGKTKALRKRYLLIVTE